MEEDEEDYEGVVGCSAGGVGEGGWETQWGRVYEIAPWTERGS